jgi:hypothetical protein
MIDLKSLDHPKGLAREGLYKVKEMVIK